MSPKEEEGFRGLSVKKQLIDAVEEFIREHPESGYKTIAEFCTDAIRRRVEEVKKTYPFSSSVNPK